MTAITLLTGSQIRDMLAAGTLTHELAIARCDEVLARTTLTANKRARWERIKADVVAHKPVDVKAAYAAMPVASTPKAAKPAVAPEAKAAKAKATFDASALARAANLCKANPEILAAFAALLAK